MLMKRKNGSFVVLFRNDDRDEVFLVHRSDLPLWSLTGGGVKKGESPEKTAIREAFEETRFTVKILRKIGTYEYFDPKTKVTTDYNYLFEGRVVSGDFIPEFPGCYGQWFKISNLPQDITDKTRQKIKDAVLAQREFYKKVSKILLRDNLHLFFRHPIVAVKFFLSRK